MESKKYYVYEWYIVDTGEIFYVGKGYISRILNNKFDHNYICAYDNQQPSQGNTDKNTLEGSTTNE